MTLLRIEQYTIYPSHLIYTTYCRMATSCGEIACCLLGYFFYRASL